MNFILNNKHLPIVYADQLNGQYSGQSHKMIFNKMCHLRREPHTVLSTLHLRIHSRWVFPSANLMVKRPFITLVEFSDFVLG